MINLIQTEFSKLKRQKTIFTIMGVLLLFWVGMTFWNYHVPQKSFEDFYMKYGSYIAMLLPIRNTGNIANGIDNAIVRKNLISIKV